MLLTQRHVTVTLHFSSFFLFFYILYCIIIYIHVNYSAEKSLSFDPRMRHTAWGVMLNLTYLFANAYGVTQTSVQRYLALKTRKDRIM